MKHTKRAAAFVMAALLILSLLPAGALSSGEPEAVGGEAPAEAVQAAAGPETETRQPSENPEAAPAGPDAALSGGDPAEGAEPEDAVVSGADPDEASSGEPEPVQMEAAGEQEPEAPAEPDVPAETDEPPAEPEPPAPMTDGDLPSSLYVNQAQRGWCTLASCTMMLRARMYLSGNDLWSSITQNGIYSSAWLPGAGVYFNWSYTIGGNRISVSHASINGISVGGLKALLDKHPEGIALYVYDVPHAIFVTDYVGDTFYGCDPAPGYSPKRQSIGSTWLGGQCGGQSGILARADAYWYVSSYSISGTRWCTLSFDANGGSCSETSRSVRAGYTFGSLPTPTRKGWVFAGWYTGREGGRQVTANSYATESITLYAHWYAVSGSIEFSEAPATIRLYTGVDSVSVTVTGTGYINSVRMEFELEKAAEGKLHAAWDGAGSGKSRTLAIRADDSASGTYHAQFYMYDSDTGMLVNQQQLTINVINENLYLDILQTSFTFAAGSDEEETVAIQYGGVSGDLPEGYEVRIENDRPEALTCTLEPFDGGIRPLVIRPKAGYDGPYPCEAELTVQLVDPGAAVCSELTVSVRLLPVTGVCGGDFEGNVRWTYEDGFLSVSIIDPLSDEGGDMWNYETEYGRAPWSCWADQIMRAEIGPGVTRIGSCAFYECSALRYVTISDTVAGIGEKAFWNCISLQSLSVPGSVDYVAPDAFHNCMELTELTFHEGTSLLSAGALDGCTALQTMYIPVSMTDLQISADTDMRDVYYGGTMSQWETLDTACSVMEKLPAGVEIHTENEKTPADAAAILAGGRTDINGDNVADLADAAALLRLLVGLKDQGGGLGREEETPEAPQALDGSEEGPTWETP